MANTLASRTYRDRYAEQSLGHILRGAMVTEKITDVVRGNDFRIQNPYGSEPTVTVQALSGNYTLHDFTLTDDALTVTDEFYSAEHVYDFEQLLTRFDLYEAREEQMYFKVAKTMDEFVLNNLCEDATGTFTTPAGGFSAANVIGIFAAINAKLDGYAETYNGKYIVLESSDMVGFYAAGATNGFTFADNVLNNGRIGQWLGIDLYVVRDGTYTNATMGTKTWTNAGHRVAGVKKMATVAMPGGIKREEKAVSLKTGREIVVWGYIGFKLWGNKSDLTIDITVTA